jgi:hypothetical protein
MEGDGKACDLCIATAPKYVLLARHIFVLKEFVVIMYDRSSSTIKVNDARLDLFARIQCPFNGIPPSRACHAVFSPFPTNADTVSQPVNA